MIQSILQPQCLDALGDVGIAVKWRVFVGHFLIILFQFLETDNNYLFWWINIIVWGFKLNNSRVCNEQIQVSTHTGLYQLPIFHCTNSVAQMCKMTSWITMSSQQNESQLRFTQACSKLITNSLQSGRMIFSSKQFFKCLKSSQKIHINKPSSTA